jgi:hypothetical protein
VCGKFSWDQKIIWRTVTFGNCSKLQLDFEGGLFTTKVEHFHPSVVISSRMNSGSIIFDKRRWEHPTTKIGLRYTKIGLRYTKIGLRYTKIGFLT